MHLPNFFWLFFTAALVRATAAQALLVSQPKNAQALADVLAEFGRGGGEEMRVVLPLGVTSLEAVNFSSASDVDDSTYAAGNLILECANSSHPQECVLDTAMQANLVPVFQGNVTLNLKGFSLVNMCEQPLAWSPYFNKSYLTSLSIAVFGRNRNSQSQTLTNMILYGRQADIFTYLYLTTIQRSIFDAVKQLSLPVISDLPLLHTNISWATASRMYVKTFHTPPAKIRDCLFVSTSDATDPLLMTMRSSNTLDKPTFCGNGTLVPDNVINSGVDQELAPMWVVTNSAEWAAAFLQTEKLATEKPGLWRPVPVILLSGAVNVREAHKVSASIVDITDANKFIYSANGTIPHSHTFSWPVLIRGPFNDDPDHIRHGEIDLTGLIHHVLLEGQGRMYMSHLRLRGLAQQPLARLSYFNLSAEMTDAYPLFNSGWTAPHDLTAMGYDPNQPSLVGRVEDHKSVAMTGSWDSPQRVMSALPLMLFKLPDGALEAIDAHARIGLHDVTLVVPRSDYLAASTIAMIAVQGTSRRKGWTNYRALPFLPDLSSCMSSDVVAATHQLLAGIGLFGVRRSNITSTSIRLCMFEGWGVNATSLTLVPEDHATLAEASTVMGCVADVLDAAIAARSRVQGHHINMRAVIIGAGVGGGVLMALLLVLSFYLRRRLRVLRPASSSSLTPPGSSNGGKKYREDVALPSITPHFCDDGVSTDISSQPSSLQSTNHHDLNILYSGVDHARASQGSFAGHDGHSTSHVTIVVGDSRDDCDQTVGMHSLDAVHRLGASAVQTPTGIGTLTSSHDHPQGKEGLFFNRSQQRCNVRQSGPGSSSPGKPCSQPNCNGSHALAAVPCEIWSRHQGTDEAGAYMQCKVVESATKLYAVVSTAEKLKESSTMPVSDEDIVRAASASLAANSSAVAQVVGRSSRPPSAGNAGAPAEESTVQVSRENVALYAVNTAQQNVAASTCLSCSPSGSAHDTDTVYDSSVQRPSINLEISSSRAPREVSSRSGNAEHQGGHSMLATIIASHGSPTRYSNSCGHGRRSTSAESSNIRSVAGGSPKSHSAKKQHKQLLASVQERAGQLDGNAANRVVVSGLLGQGSWGKVFKGEWRGIPVALKTLVFESDSDLASRLSRTAQPGDDFTKKGAQHQVLNSCDNEHNDGANRSPQAQAIMEATIAASVGHRNVVCTYQYDILPLGCPHDHVAQGGNRLEIAHPVDGNERMTAYKLFLVQELCATTLLQAASLGAMTNGATGKTEDLPVLLMLLDIAQGLTYLHSKAIIHGDLKPANVLLKEDSTCPAGVVAKLADFGLSSYMCPGATHVSNYHGGTPFYVAPEVVLHFRISPAADIYAFGVIMWQLYSGEEPYCVLDDNAGNSSKRSAGATAARKRGDRAFAPNPNFPGFQPPRVAPREYADLMLHCLSRDPALRPSAKEVIHSLTAMLVSLGHESAAQTVLQQQPQGCEEGAEGGLMAAPGAVLPELDAPAAAVALQL